MVDEITQMLEIAELYATHTGHSLATVGTYTAGAGAFFKKLQNGGGITLKKYHTLMGWFSSNWPSHITRPTPKPKSAKIGARNHSKVKPQ